MGDRTRKKTPRWTDHIAPHAPATRIDLAVLNDAVQSTMHARQLSLRAAAAAAGVSASTLTRLSQGKRPDVDSFLAIITWLGMPAENFLGGATHGEPDPIAMLSMHLRAGRHLSPEGAAALEKIARAAFEHLTQIEKTRGRR